MSKRSKIRVEYYNTNEGQYWKTMNTTATPTIEYVKWLEDKIIKLSERQSTTEVSEQHDSKALHIADVSGCLLEFMLWYKQNVPIGTQKSSKEIVSDFLNNR